MSDQPHQTDHDRLQRMVRLAADRDRVWAEIGGFDRIADWHPLIESVELTQIEGETYRHLRTTEGELFFERLIEAGPHHVTYEVQDSPLPVSDFRATLACVAEEGGCHVYWSAFFVPAEEQGHLSDDIVAKFYEIGLEALQSRYG